MSSDLECLKHHFQSLLNNEERLVVAWSGGVDSTVVAHIAAMVGGDRVVAVTADTEFVARAEIERTRLLGAELGLQHEIVTVEMLGDAAIRSNDRLRCYYCKKKILRALSKACPGVVLDGTNASDDALRPGRQALKEARAVSPLLECGLDKGRVRALARSLGLPNAEQPSNSCLATRITNESISRDLLERIEEVENFLYDIGLLNVRARYDDLKMIIEVGQDTGLILERNHERIKDRVLEMGWTLAGYGFRKDEQ